MLPDLPIHSDPSQPPPVFDCHVLITGPDEAGRLHGVVSNLPEITAEAGDERALLRKLVDQFKARLAKYHADQEEIPWQPKQKPTSEPQQRWIPVHL